MKKRYDIPTIVCSVLIVLGVFLATVIFQQDAIDALQAARKWCITHLGGFIMVFVGLLLFFVLFIAFSKFGEIRMGTTKPQYSRLSYAAMVFSAAMGSSMIFWPSVEWAEYIIGVGMYPFDWDTATMAQYSISYSFFHWGFPAWAIYAVGIIPIGYRYYVMKKPGLNLQGALEGVVKPSLLEGKLGTVINIFFVVATLGGLTITFGTGVPMVANFMHNLFGTSEGFVTEFLIVVVLAVIFTASALKGIGKGHLRLSVLCVAFCCIMLALIFVLGNTGFIVEETGRSLLYHFQNFFPMLFNLGDAQSDSSFALGWTVFYWTWWLGLAPVMWIFIAKCSKGMTLRSIILTVILSGFLSTVLFFGVISGNGLSLFQNFDWSTLGSGQTAIDAFFNSWNEYQFISDILTESTPYYPVIICVWIIGCIVLLTTTLDSATHTLAEATQKDIPLGEDPSKKLRLFWAIVLAIIPLVLLALGQPTSTFISIVIISSIPIVIIIVLAVVGSVRWLFRDFGSMSRKEIREHFKIEE